MLAAAAAAAAAHLFLACSSARACPKWNRSKMPAARGGGWRAQWPCSAQKHCGRRPWPSFAPSPSAYTRTGRSVGGGRCGMLLPPLGPASAAACAGGCAAALPDCRGALPAPFCFTCATIAALPPNRTLDRLPGSKAWEPGIVRTVRSISGRTAALGCKAPAAAAARPHLPTRSPAVAPTHALCEHCLCSLHPAAQIKDGRHSTMPRAPADSQPSTRSAAAYAASLCASLTASPAALNWPCVE